LGSAVGFTLSLVFVVVAAAAAAVSTVIVGLQQQTVHEIPTSSGQR